MSSCGIKLGPTVHFSPSTQPASTPKAQEATAAPFITRLGRQTARSLAQSAQQLHGHSTEKQYKDLPAALRDINLQKLPQFRRASVPGCICITGSAGGGCCPGAASSLAVQIGCGAHVLMAWVGLALSLFGLYSGITVFFTNLDSLDKSTRVRQHIRAQHAGWQLFQAELSPLPQLTVSRQAADKKIAALSRLDHALTTSMREQRFNLWVPGVLQTFASAVGIAAAAAHLYVGLAGLAGTGVLASALFAAYGSILAAKYLLDWHHTATDLALPDGEGAQNPEYATACADHLRARRHNLGRTAAAWGCVGVASLLGTLVGAGMWAPPFAAGGVLVASIASAGWAMWQNSRTRYVLHIPISSHTEASSIGMTEQRATTFKYVVQQDQAVKDLTSIFLQDQSYALRLQHCYETLFAPQCGPRANRILPKKVQNLRTVATSSAAKRQTYCVRTQIGAMRIFCANELALMHARQTAEHDSLQQEYDALRPALGPDTCQMKMQWGDPQASAYTQVFTRLRNAAEDLELRARTLTVIGHVQKSLRKLQAMSDTELLAYATAPEPTEWTWVRLVVLQLSGTLGEAVEAEFVQQYPKFFSRLAPPDVWPINNLYVLPQYHQDFAQAFAPHLDGAFMHAFFNPRRIEAERDYLLDLEIEAAVGGARTPQNAATTAARLAAPAADCTTCCG